MLTWGRIRRALQPAVLKYWLNQRSKQRVCTRVEGLDLEVFPGVFHPRYFGSSTILARLVASLPLQRKAFLEIGCGSGVVALCAAKAGADVVAVDINPEAVRCTIANAARNGLHVDVRLGDLFSPLVGTRFDVVAWNPPFLLKEPGSLSEAAFYGGPNFEVIRRFTNHIREHLNANAVVYTIVSADIDIEQIEQLFRAQAFAVSRVLSQRWGLGETMVVLCAR